MELQERPLPGKTFTLFGASDSAENYYQDVEHLTDTILADIPAPELLDMIRKESSGRRIFFRRSPGRIRRILDAGRPVLSPYLENVEEHIGSLSLRRRFDRVLRTSRRQYMLYMIEIELVNRLNRKLFLESEYRLGFLPHCIRNLSKKCKAQVDDEGIDYMCRRCSKTCFIRKVSEILEDARVRPYIWMKADLRRLFRRLKKEHRRIGVFGMACIPELVNGMRLCGKAHIPVIGIPINANRCRRWMGEFYENSVHLDALRKLMASVSVLPG